MTRPPPDAPSPEAASPDAGRVAINLLGLLVQASGPAYHALLSHALGAGGYGLFAWSTSLVDGLSLFVVFGMDLAVRRFVGEALARGRRDDAHAATGAALRLVWSLGLLLVVAMFLAAPALARWQGKPALVPPLRILAVGPVFYYTTTVFINATQAAGFMRYGFWARTIAQPVMLFALLGLVLHLRPGTAPACSATVGAIVVTTLVSGVFYHRLFGLGPTLRAAARRPESDRVVRFARPLVLAGVTWMVLARLDLMFFGPRASGADVGVYSGALMFASSVAQTKGAFETVAAAFIPQALATGDLDGLRASLRRQTRWAALVTVPVFVVFGGFSDVVLGALGPGFTRGARALTILAAGQLVGALCLSPWVVALSGRAAWQAATGVAFLAVDALLLRVLIPRYGMEGVALATAVTVAGSQLALAFLAYRIARVQPWSAGVFGALAAGAVAIVAGRLTLGAWAGPILPRFFAAGAVAAAAYLLLLVALGLHAEERALLSRLARGAAGLFARRG